MGIMRMSMLTVAGGVRFGYRDSTEFRWRAGLNKLRSERLLPFERAGFRVQRKRKVAAVRGALAVESAADDRGAGISGAGLLERP